MMTVSEIRALLAKADAGELAALVRSLSADERKGVQAAIEVAQRRLKAQEAEVERLRGLYAFDRSFVAGLPGGKVVGLDEVGRGSVAGPLAVGAVVLASSPVIEGLDDSKRLASETREAVASDIRMKAAAWSVCFVEPQEIDSLGMAQSLRKAFAGALEMVEAQGIAADVVLIDGNRLGIDERERNVVKGDSKSAAIAAASIVAKVERDAFMCGIDSTFPQYGFSNNKGYASKAHVDAIGRYGLSPVHRKTFCRSFLQESLF